MAQQAAEAGDPPTAEGGEEPSSGGQDPETPPPTDTELTEARALFEAGQAAFENGRPADAQEFFRRSLLVTPHASTAFNLVIALRATNDIMDAIEVLDRLLDGDYGELISDERRQAQDIHRELVSRLATLRLRSNHGGPVEVAIDGRNAGRIEPGELLDHVINPGSYLVTGTNEDEETVTETVELSAGETLELSLTFEEDIVTDPKPPWQRAWFWILTVGVPAVALVTGLGLWAGLRDSEGTEWEPVSALLLTPRW